MYIILICISCDCFTFAYQLIMDRVHAILVGGYTTDGYHAWYGGVLKPYSRGPPKMVGLLVLISNKGSQLGVPLL